MDDIMIDDIEILTNERDELKKILTKLEKEGDKSINSLRLEIHDLRSRIVVLGGKNIRFIHDSRRGLSQFFR